MTMTQVHASLSRPNEVLPYNDDYNYHVINIGHLLHFALVGQHGLGPLSHSGIQLLVTGNTSWICNLIECLKIRVKKCILNAETLKACLKYVIMSSTYF